MGFYFAVASRKFFMQRSAVRYVCRLGITDTSLKGAIACQNVRTIPANQATIPANQPTIPDVAFCCIR